MYSHPSNHSFGLGELLPAGNNWEGSGQLWAGAHNSSVKSIGARGHQLLACAKNVDTSPPPKSGEVYFVL